MMKALTESGQDEAYASEFYTQYVTGTKYN